MRFVVLSIVFMLIILGRWKRNWVKPILRKGGCNVASNYIYIRNNGKHDKFFDSPIQMANISYPKNQHGLQTFQSIQRQEVLHVVSKNVRAWQQLPVFKRRDHAFSDHLFEMASIKMESEVLKESMIHGHHVFKQIWALQVEEINLCGSPSLLCICLHDDHQLFCRFLSSSRSLDLSSCCLSSSYQYVSYLMLLYLVYALNKWCHIPGRKYTPNKWYVLNNESLW